MPRARARAYRDNLTDVNEIKREVDNHLYNKFEGVVQGGPFKGMKILRETSWEPTRLAPYLLGCYEAELHDPLEREIARLNTLPEPKIVVVGSAEGYYAIGLKLRIPHALVFVVDPDEKAIDICGRAAAVNGVAIIVGAPIDQILRDADYIFMDCEGEERHYLDPVREPALLKKRILVEVHNLGSEDGPILVDDILMDRFQKSHEIWVHFEGPRNPNIDDHMCEMHNDYRWLAISENRPVRMYWFSMTPKEAVP